MLSQSAEYALRAVLLLARQGDGERLCAERLAEALGAPRNYMGKVLHALARRGVLVSHRGPGGGFALARDPDELSLFDVVEPFGELLEKRTCLLGQAECSDAAPCTAHGHWKSVGDRVAFFFRETTVGAMVGAVPVSAAVRSNGRPPAHAQAAQSAPALTPAPEEGT